MTQTVLIYLAALFAMLVPDIGWLALAGPRLYRPALGDLLSDKFSPAPAGLFYLIYAVGLVVFTADDTLAGAAGRGALFGLCAFGTYDLTNQATLRRWPTYLTLADLAWGTLISAFAALVAAFVRQKLGSA